MVLTQKLNLNTSGDLGPAINGPITVTGESGFVHEMVLANDTSQVLLQAIATAQLQYLYMMSTIAATVTFRDGGGASVGSKVLAANVPYAWVSGLGDIPISDDVASINISSAAVGALKVRGLSNAVAEATVALSGTITSAVESQIVTGGRTIILTLTGATWLAAGAAFNAQRQAIIDGLDSAQAEAAGWDAQVRPAMVVTNVVRTSASVVTITLPAVAGYVVTANETITATVPAPATTAQQAIVASPTATITANS